MVKRFLWHSAFCDVQTRDDLQPAGHAWSGVTWHGHDIAKQTINPVSNANPFTLRFDMYVAGSGSDRVTEMKKCLQYAKDALA